MEWITPVAALCSLFLGFIVGLFVKVGREVPDYSEMGWQRGFYVRVEGGEDEQGAAE